MNIKLRQVGIAAAILGAVIAALLLNRVVVTDRQRVERVIRTMAAAAEEGDVRGIFSHISEDFQDDAVTREDLQRMAVGFFLINHHVRIEIQRMTVTVSGTLARVDLNIRARAEESGNTSAAGSSEWTGTLQKEADGEWRVKDIAPVRMGGADVSGWRDMARRYQYE